MGASDAATCLPRSRAPDLSGIPWDAVPRHPLPPEAVRTLRYMQNIESHTIVYLRELLGTRTIDDPDVAAFLACWFYEETHHGLALARFLAAAGHDVVARTRSDRPWSQRLEERAIGVTARLWPDFGAVHMTWGAINELTTLVGHQRLAATAGHPGLTALLERIMLDGVQPPEETRALGRYLLSGPDGITAARRIDVTIRKLPGFAGANLVEAWLEAAPAVAAA